MMRFSFILLFLSFLRVHGQDTTRLSSLEEVVILSTRSSNDFRFTQSTYTREQLSPLNLAQDLPILLDQSPSLVNTSDAGAGVGYTGLRIRGSDQTRINVTINGIPLNDAESQNVFWVNTPDFVSSTENIQIQRGVGTSANGGAAFGASLHLQTDKIEEQPYAELSGSFGSFNTWKASAQFATGLIKKHFFLQGRLSEIATKGYVDRAEADLKSYFIHTGYQDDKNLLQIFNFSGKEITYQSWYGVPKDSFKTNPTYNYYNYPNQVDDYYQDHTQLHYTRNGKKNTSYQAALHYTRGKGYFEEYKGPEYNNDDGFNARPLFSSYGLPDQIVGTDTISETSLVRRRWLSNHFTGFTFSATQQPHAKLFMISGIASNIYLGDHYGEIIWAQVAGNLQYPQRYYQNDGIKLDQQIFSKISWSAKARFHTFLDLQYRRVDHRFSGIDNDQRTLDIDRTFHFFNPKAGFDIRLQEKDYYYLTLAIGNREPNRADLSDAPAGKEPKSERLYNLETGYLMHRYGMDFQINYYLMYYTDQLVLTGELNDVGGPVKVNVDRSYRTGIEASLSYTLPAWMKVAADVSYALHRIPRFTETLYRDFGASGQQEQNYTNTPISFSPNIIAGISLAFNHPSGLSAIISNKIVSKQYLDNTGSNDRQLDPYSYGNLSISYKLHLKKLDFIEWKLLLNNFGNRRYASNGYVFSDFSTAANQRVDYVYLYPQAGIHVLAGMVVRM